MSARLNQQSAASKNARRREIAQKTKIEAQGKILGVLDKMATKLDDILKLFVKDDKRIKEQEREQKHKSLARKWWDSKSKSEKKEFVKDSALAGLGIGGLFMAANTDIGEQPIPNAPDVDEAEPEPKKGEQIINGARVILGPNVHLNGLNQDFLKRLLAAAKEYQEKYGGPALPIGSAYRTFEEQKKLRAQAEASGHPNKAARAGRSVHEFGFAADTNSKIMDDMERLGILAHYNLGRPAYERWKQKPENKGKKTGEDDERWHVEDMSISEAVKEKMKNKGSQSEFATNLRKSHSFVAVDPLLAGLPDEQSEAEKDAIKDVLAESMLLSMAGQMAQQQADAQQAGPIGIFAAANGGMVEAIAGEAGPELILPMNQRGGEILASSIKEAFKEMANTGVKRRSVDKFKTFFEGRFLPELRKQLGKH